MRFKLLTLVIVLQSVSVCYAMENTKDESIVPGSSYFIFEEDERELSEGILAEEANGTATFYNALGDELAQATRQKYDYCKLKCRLDLSAPKPQPVTYAIKYWPVIPTGVRLKWGAPGYFIVFCDKHGNYIRSYKYDHETEKISFFSYHGPQWLDLKKLPDLDTTIAYEKGSDEIRDHSDETRPKWCAIQ